MLLKWTKKRLKVVLVVLDAFKRKFPETIKFIDDTMEDECQKEKISVEEVMFFTGLEAKSYLRKHFLFCSEYVKTYCIKLNSFGYNIYLCVI